MTTDEELDPHYLSYMLRMWRKRDENGQPVWHASLEAPGSHHTENFGDTGALFSYLWSRLEIADPVAPGRVAAPPDSSSAPQG
jgi:hypothetical protein